LFCVVTTFSLFSIMKYGLIAAGEKHTAEAGQHILESGGNAFDAAVAAVLTSMTSEYALTSAGGGGACLAWPKNKKPIVYDFFVDAPKTDKNRNIEFFETVVNFGTTKQLFHIGKGSIAVPGCIKGLFQIHKELGILPIEQVMEPAIRAARFGIRLNKCQAYVIKLLEPILTYNQLDEQILTKSDGTLIGEGDILKNPDFGDFLEILIKEGPDYFYSGIGSNLILSQSKSGGFLDERALQQYQVYRRHPVKSQYHGKTIYSNPAPSTGGTLIGFFLAILNESKLSPSPENIALAMNITHQARHHYKKESYNILSKNNINTFKSKIENQEWVFKKTNPSGRGDTTQVSILDKEGNAVSITTTNGEGSGYSIPGMGVVLNNMLGEEDLNPDGFHLWEKQVRIPSMIAPTIVASDAGPELILGSGGSNRIRSAISQVIINYFQNNKDIETSIAHPRIHLEGSSLHCEPGIKLDFQNKIPEEVDIIKWNNQNMFFGGVNAVTNDAAVGDQRRGGVGIVC
jgi:gamma-glutamyltranspeptidase / glutathione hydrolase